MKDQITDDVCDQDKPKVIYIYYLEDLFFCFLAFFDNFLVSFR